MNGLIIVDLQNDFIPGGALAVPEGDIIIPLINRLQPQFDLVVATQDWHPANHGSFAVNHPGRYVYDQINLNGLSQVLWPVHCVQNTKGAELVTGLDRQRIAKVFHKGTDPDVDSYSGFYDNGHRHATGLADYLRDRGVTDVYVVGLATDYCVKFTALDAVAEGFRTHLIANACRGVNVAPGDVDGAIEGMRRNGITILQTNEVTNRRKQPMTTIDPKRAVRLSKFLSLVLRHEPSAAGITLDPSGWVDVDDLLRGCLCHGVPLTREELERLVADSDKQRFALSPDRQRIRANQGHSITVDLGYQPSVPPAILYHGTVEKFLPSIRQEGLTKGQRHHVHLSVDEVTASKVGERRGRPVILHVRAADMQQDGMLFLISNNGVWLTDHVPARYIEFPKPTTQET